MYSIACGGANPKYRDLQPADRPVIIVDLDPLLNSGVIDLKGVALYHISIETAQELLCC